MLSKHRKEYQKKYYEANKYKMLGRSREYYENNRNKKKEYDKEYRKNNKQKRKKNDKKYYLKNKHRIKEWVLKNRDKIKDFSLKKRFNITLEQYNEMFTKQNGRCKICSKHQSEIARSLSVDHDHITGKVRGLLCSNCNCVLGLVKDSVDILEKSKLYLQTNGS